jgi:translation elongation factor EF-Tu-like GTPase
MWIVEWLPSWIFTLVSMAGAAGILASIFLGAIPIISKYSLPIKVVSICVLAFGLYMMGGVANQERWEAKVKDLEVKLAKAEAESQKENTKIVEKVVTKTQIIKERGEDIIRYVDREIVKYDVKFAPGGICEIPKEFVKAHNDAAEKLK